LVIPCQVDSSHGDVRVTSDAGSANFFLFGQAEEAGWVELENLFDEIPGDDVALEVTGVNGTFSELGNGMLITALVVRKDVYGEDVR
jgi:hypothetical protein